MSVKPKKCNKCQCITTQCECGDYYEAATPAPASAGQAAPYCAYCSGMGYESCQHLAAQPVATVQQNGKREGFEAAAKALQERAVGHFRNKDYKLQDECLQCASMLHDMKPAATPSPQVAEKVELPKQSCEIWRKEGKNGDIVIGPKPQGEGWAAWTIPGYAPYQGSWPNFTELDAQAIASQADVPVERSVLLKLTDLGRRYFSTLLSSYRAPASAGQAGQVAKAGQHLINAGALRQYRHNDGSEGFVFAYDKAITDREFARLSTTERAAADHQHSFAADGYCLDCDAKEPQPEAKGSK